MPEKSKQVLIKYWVTSTIWIEERSVKVTISEQHGDGTCKNW
jgi:hypothetical protein